MTPEKNGKSGSRSIEIRFVLVLTLNFVEESMARIAQDHFPSAFYDRDRARVQRVKHAERL
jgi:hypothetical protein